jgi:hypothetical protein
MKNIKFLFSAAFCGLFFAFAVTASADDMKQGVATVVTVKGEASYTLGGGDGWHPLVVGKILQAGSSISTKPDAVVDVILGKSFPVTLATRNPDRVSLASDSAVRGMVGYQAQAEQNVVRLSGGTTLKIDTLTISDTGVDTVSDTELDLQAGRIFASVKKLSESSKYLVKFPNGIAGVRGTKFTLAADGSCGCIEHSVWVSYVGSDGKPNTFEVGEGTQFDSGTGQSQPLPPEFLNLLEQISTEARTLFFEIESFAFSRTECIQPSPTTGFNPQP